MPQYWMISDRSFKDGTPGSDVADPTYWTSDAADITKISAWTSRSAADFQNQLVRAADQFPLVAPGDNARQKHVCFLIHGYNEGFADAASLYHDFVANLFTGADGLGICISMDWPSLGSILGYEPDREHARECADDVADVFDTVHKWLLDKQQQTADDATQACKAKVSLVAHSMGNYVMQKALAAVWKRNNQPLSVSLVNQLVMIAADVDNDLFDGNSEDATDGEAVANLSYRVTALYSGRDDVLGVSAGLKHFGTRRLGRSGLANRPPVTKNAEKRDNIWDVDCSGFFPASVAPLNIHGEYFRNDGTLHLIREILRGTDRSVMTQLGLTAGSAWPPKPATP